ncbi:G-protein coupled receptor Mth isoform X2 [Drosophila elegans]|uniref:G-protein coupled receptor Mth isoform X2 n=2 Tax=Drosophila elegans TaxID=30023 RepID=UPI0007E76EE0|nr:G-protein coupled receptor Mth isoform X2 [Drosophila elegans]
MRILPRLFATVLLLIAQKTNADISDCDFFDTVNISTAQKLSNGSYLYEDLVIPAHLTGEYDYKLLSDDSKEKVASHLRGCVCKLKPCIRFCCPHDHIMHEGTCYDDMTQEESDGIDPFVNLTLGNGSVVTRHFKKEFILQWDLPMPCANNNMFYLDSREETDKYTLFENGTFKRHHDNAFFSKREYCLQHMELNDEVEKTTFLQIVPHTCLVEQSETGRTAQTVVMIISLICMVLTISVYLFVKKLQNLHGKCFICYMVCLFMGYLFLLLNLWHLSFSFCITAGFLGYFFVMAAFFWLSVISLHLWNTFSGTSHQVNRFLPESRFLTYNMFAWGMAALLTGVTYLAAKFVENENWNPRVGKSEECWIFTLEWSAMLYFYGPMLLLIVFNITMFILTSIRIMRVKRDIQNFANKQDRKQKLNSDKQTYTFFLRLFIIMGLSWSFEIISYLVQSNKPWANALMVADYFNWGQGIIIFVLFILKPSTLRLLKERHHPKTTWSAISSRSRVSRSTTGASFNRFTRTNSSAPNTSLK